MPGGSIDGRDFPPVEAPEASRQGQYDMRQPTRHRPRRFAAMLIATALFAALAASPPALARVHTVFFEDTDYELHVYRIFGKIPGKTLMLIGGIQGNEPGSFHSADLYTELSLAQGNLIVVPRANFKSIVLNRRQINEDMNRKFAEDTRYNYETKIVAILKKLISESDALLNLHDGSGFYSDQWESPNRNPMRYGQSIIADCDVYHDPKTGKTIRLGSMARAISERVNRFIENPEHHIRFNNHRTKDPDTPHREQRKSATFYALYTYGIPAFGVEASKSLPLESKIQYHNLIINAFMEAFDIVPETPTIRIEKPKLRYLVVSVNDALPVVLENHQTLEMRRGDTLTISHIEANYERGLSVDILGYGALNDIRKRFVITKPTRVIVKKDSFPCGAIDVKLGGPGRLAAATPQPQPERQLKYFRVKVNGEEQTVETDARLEVTRGDKLQIVEVITDGYDPTELVVNFKGFVGNPLVNDGEDRGFVIDTQNDLWRRYALDQAGTEYQVVVSLDQEVLGKMYVHLKDR
jgi:hypothetical protein